MGEGVSWYVTIMKYCALRMNRGNKIMGSVIFPLLRWENPLSIWVLVYSLPPYFFFLIFSCHEFIVIIVYGQNILQSGDFFTQEEGMPKTPFPNGWNGGNGLYAVGFTRRGLLGTASDAVKIAGDIAQQWRTLKDTNNLCNTHCIPRRNPCQKNNYLNEKKEREKNCVRVLDFSV